MGFKSMLSFLSKVAAGVLTGVLTNRINRKSDKSELEEQLITRNDIINSINKLCFVAYISAITYSGMTLMMSQSNNRLIQSSTALGFSGAVLAITPSQNNNRKEAKR